MEEDGYIQKPQRVIRGDTAQFRRFLHMSDQHDFIGEKGCGEKYEADEVHERHPTGVGETEHHDGDHSRKAFLSVELASCVEFI